MANQYIPKLQSCASSLCVGVLIVLLQSCFTGVEGTKKIEVPKNIEYNSQPSPEDLYLNDIAAQPLSDWKMGKQFYATENRIAVILKKNGSEINNAELEGSILYYNGCTKKTGIDGRTIDILSFRTNTDTYYYDTSVAVTDTIFSDKIPMMIDLDMINQTRNKLINKKLWTTSSIWYDKNGELITGKKFVLVTITDIKPGNKVFPAKVEFITSDSIQASMLINIGSQKIKSRPFSSLFKFANPHNDYPQIDNEIWTLIQNGQLQQGMTKQECKLSLGNPKETSTTHDYAKLIEFWHYNDGSYLQFEDGLLVKFRH